jgi:hypothetical protein
MRVAKKLAAFVVNGREGDKNYSLDRLLHGGSFRTAFGKIARIEKANETVIECYYNAGGNRTAKIILRIRRRSSPHQVHIKSTSKAGQRQV